MGNENNKVDFSILIKYQSTILKEIFTELRRIKDFPDAMLSNELNLLLVKLQLQINAHPNVEYLERKATDANQAFLKKLKRRYPTLTRGEMELCIWFKLGLTNKEIAVLKNVNLTSVKKSRQRLRKKLTLKKDEDIYYMLKLL